MGWIENCSHTYEEQEVLNAVQNGFLPALFLIGFISHMYVVSVGPLLENQDGLVIRVRAQD